MIFGLPRDARIDEIHHLLASCWIVPYDLGTQLQVEVHAAAGRSDESFAVIELWPDRLMLCRLADALNRRRLRGRALSTWAPVLAWE